MGNSPSENRKPKNPRHTVIGIPAVKPPRPFLTKDEFLQTWPSWRRDFLMFKHTLNDRTSDKNKWGNMLLNIMGPVGQDIHSTFTYSSLNCTENMDVLLEKFDEYYAFVDRKKRPREGAQEYLHDLLFSVKEKNISNGEECIREKILTEIDKHQFTNAARTVLPAFSFSSDFKKLTLREIVFIWNIYDNNSVTNNCPRCGNEHMADKCPALGKHCSRCNERNHFHKRCPQIFIENCGFCGGTHYNKKCPAYNETCTKCNRLNHFSWKCRVSHIPQCRFCGSSHSAQRSRCPANTAVCPNCKMIGHFGSKCNKGFHSRKR